MLQGVSMKIDIVTLDYYYYILDGQTWNSVNYFTKSPIYLLLKHRSISFAHRQPPVSTFGGASGSWSYAYWIYNYLCNQCLSPLKSEVWILLTVRCTRYNIMWKSLSVTWDKSVVFSVYSVSSTNKSDLHISTEILLKEAINAIALHQTPILVMLLFRF
jgi:hypothetical protein